MAVLLNIQTMKLFNLKKVAGASALVVGSFLSFSASAQTCLDPNVSIGAGQTCSSQISITSNPATVTIGSGGLLTTTIDNGIRNTGAGVSINNAGSIVSVDNRTVNWVGNAIYSTGTVTQLVNTGTISGAGDTSRPSGMGVALRSGGATTLIDNGGSISGSYGIYYGVAINSLNNSGSINGITNGVIGGGSVATLTNSGSIFASINTVYNTGSITTLNNTVSGTIKSEFIGIANGGTIGAINNAGLISSNPTLLLDGYGISNTGTITSITNTGTIAGSGGNGVVGIDNSSSIINLNNAQGVGNTAGALTYKGALPTNYNIIINSPNYYGQLLASNSTGSTNFGISNLSANVQKGTYASVLSGITSAQLSSLTGSYNGSVWTLVSNNNNIWNLIFGISTADTQQSLVNTAQALQGTFTILNTALTNSFAYDCNEFGANNICISAGGRNTAVSAANGLNNTSALLIAAYRPHPNYRIGAYADQNLSVNNAGSTVNLGNNTPLIGLFGAWNERQDGTGTEVKVSAAYGQKNTTITRQVVGTGATASEAGNGGAPINSQGAQVVAKYGFGVMKDVIVSPYAGVRYTQSNMGGYTEGTSSSVTAPLTYSALNTNATTALAGVGASYRGIPQTTLFASAGVESDTNTSNGTYSATGINGLTPVNFNANPVKTRATATLGASYDVAKNQRLGITGIYRQEPYQAVQTTTVMATYTVGL